MIRPAVPILFVGVIGPPASGKSTLTARLRLSLHAPVIGPRDAIRSTVESQPRLHGLFTPVNALGWVSDAALGLAVRTAVTRLPHTCELAVLENLPGDDIQVADIHALARQRGGRLLVLHLDGDDDTLLRRGLTRRVCPACDAHEPALPSPSSPGHCARCAAPLTTRTDDAQDILSERTTRHRRYARSVLRIIDALGVPLTHIDATADPATAEAIAIRAITGQKLRHL